MISEETFAKEEARLGKQVHFHDGVWWVKVAPFYYKPVHEFRPFPPKSAKPHSLKALMGYSHQVLDRAQATRFVRWNVIQGDDLRSFSLERLKGKRRNMVRGGMRECHVEMGVKVESHLDQMKTINISQARRFAGHGEGGTFLSADYYELHEQQWREDMLKLFSHQGHQFIGGFVGENLAAYVDLIQVEDTWLFGAVKSCDDYLKHRPVDALYFTILSTASQSSECNRVVNGGGHEERASLTRFKGEFLLLPMDVPYYTRSVLQLERLRKLQSMAANRRRGPSTNEDNVEEKACAKPQE